MAARICLTEGCGKEGTMMCPSCAKLGLPEAHFCSQECFQSSWDQHKLLHKLAKSLAKKEAASTFTPDGEYNPWPTYQYTGKHRPHRVTPMREIPDNIPKPDYFTSGESQCERDEHPTNVVCHNAEERDKLRRAAILGREILTLAGKAVRPGVTCDEIDRIVHEASIERGGYPSPYNYRGFPKSCCTSVNEVICHGIPDLYELKDGDIVNVDVSLYFDGFHSDLNETFLVGNVDEEGRHLVQTSYDCMMAGIAVCGPGKKYKDVGRAIEKLAHKRGCSVVTSYCGHGIGRLFHANPSVPHYSESKVPGFMRPGHCFTIEPMINLGTYKDQTWPDDWTSVTRDGKRSAQFEHMVLITEDGYEILTERRDGSSFLSP